MELILTDAGSYVSRDDPGERGFTDERSQPRVSITDEEGEILAGLTRGLVVLEIGTGLGVATRWMAKTARLVYTTDNDEWVRSTTWLSLGALDNVALVFHSEALPMVDAAFIDGLHRERAVLQDIGMCLPKLRVPWALIFHDMKCDAVKAAVTHKFGEDSWEYVDTRYGLGIIRKGSEGG